MNTCLLKAVTGLTRVSFLSAIICLPHALATHTLDSPVAFDINGAWGPKLKHFTLLFNASFLLQMTH